MAKEKQDLKEEVIEIPSSIGQEEKSDESKEKKPKKAEKKVEEPEEDIESLPDWAKTRLSKLEKDKDVYKKGMFGLKEKYELTKPKKKKKEEEEEYPEWDETSKKFQKQTIVEAEKRAEKAATDTVEKSNEKTAVANFLKDNPEVTEHWDEIVSNYNPKHGKDTVDSIIKDLKRAHLLARYEAGELDKKDKGEKKGEAKLAELSSVSKTTSKVVPKGSALSAQTIEMAKRMRVDPKEVAKEDDSSTAEIKF